MKPVPPAVEGEVLTTGLPGKSLPGTLDAPRPESWKSLFLPKHQFLLSSELPIGQQLQHLCQPLPDHLPQPEHSIILPVLAALCRGLRVPERPHPEWDLLCAPQPVWLHQPEGLLPPGERPDHRGCPALPSSPSLGARGLRACKGVGWASAGG